MGSCNLKYKSTYNLLRELRGLRMIVGVVSALNLQVEPDSHLSGLIK